MEKEIGAGGLGVTWGARASRIGCGHQEQEGRSESRGGPRGRVGTKWASGTCTRAGEGDQNQEGLRGRAGEGDGRGHRVLALGPRREIEARGLRGRLGGGGIGCVHRGRGGRSKSGGLRGRSGRGGVGPMCRGRGREIGAGDGGMVARNWRWRRGRMKPGMMAGSHGTGGGDRVAQNWEISWVEWVTN